MNENKITLLVGDNPFLGISHLSQERARDRENTLDDPKNCAHLVAVSVMNGADGFMFSVCDKTLAIIKELHKNDIITDVDLYAIVPYAFEYVRLAAQTGGFSGLAKKVLKDMVSTGDLMAILRGLKGVAMVDISSLIKAYLSYEISRIKSSAGKKGHLKSIMLHQAVTDLALSFNLKSLFKAYANFTSGLGIKPGFNTGNFPLLVQRLKEWGINLSETVIAAPFNKVGFQMNPSKEGCEKALAAFPEPTVIAISVLAAGYLKPLEAVDYIKALPNIDGVVVGVSKEKHANETFRLFRESFAETGMKTG
ncbi:MAG: hypothetical protein QXG76_00750 [Candidatus Bathyarchaeia archaeon]